MGRKNAKSEFCYILGEETFLNIYFEVFMKYFIVQIFINASNIIILVSTRLSTFF